MNASTPFAIAGAGPAGLAAALSLAERGRPAVVFEKDSVVGGLSRTVEHRGFRCDIGGHRFFTKNAEVDALWRRILPEDFLRRPRMSRIYYRGRFFDYPLRPMNALRGLGFLQSARVMGGYLRRRVFPRRPEDSFEAWVANRFGDGLYEIFFKTYTEKVWGVPCREISADWAAQRIRNLNLGRAVLSALGLGGRRSVTSLIEEFDYPRLGPGQMYEAMARRAESAGARIRLGGEVLRVRHAGGRVTAVVTGTAGTVGAGSGFEETPVGVLVSTMPLTELVERMDPPAPPAVLDAARALRYRSIITANLILPAREVLPDTWVYLHEPSVRAGRLQLYKNWSPAMVPDAAQSSLGFEYFAFEGDDLWRLPDADLLKLAAADLGRMKIEEPEGRLTSPTECHPERSLPAVAGEGSPALAKPALEILRSAQNDKLRRLPNNPSDSFTSKVSDGFVVRYAKAYPVYELGYRRHLDTIRAWLAGFGNLACAGRYGQFRYNNMDHSIVTAQLAVRRLLGDEVDPWAVNEDAEYHEEKNA